MISRLRGRGPFAFLATLCVYGLVGCSGSGNAATHDAAAVESMLAKHGFDVRVVFDRKAGEPPDDSILGLLNPYTPLEDITALVADTSSDGAIGSVISAWVFDAQTHADLFQPDAALRLQKGNVVLLVDDTHRPAASAALDDLD